ncbi:MAG TPA: serine protease [Phycisphaerales bacterium]|nr:serine protease [Phycisphaerales bacterium]HBR20159.1 serine protease [Phycisphaerales bacterium]
MERKRILSIGFVLAVIFGLNSFCIAAPADSKELEMLRNTGEVFAEIAEKVTPAVVFVSVEQEVSQQQTMFSNPFEEFNDEFFKRFFDQRMPQNRQQPKQQKQIRKGQGSGFIITADGFILTNNHVVENADKITVKLSDERELVAKVIGTDPETDVAVIKVDANNLPFVELGDSDQLKVGQWVIAIGNPFGLSHTVTAGIVSAKGRSKIGLTEYEDFIQTDAAINFGNSGGPLLNIDGKVIGINSAIFSRSGGYMGIGFAIPVNMAKYVYQQLVADGKVTRGYLGLYGEDITADMAKLFGIENQKGVIVNKLLPDGPAAKGGVERGDVIIKKDGKAIEDWNIFRNEIARTAPGTKIELTVIREGKEKEIAVELEPRESKAVTAQAAEKQSKQIGITVQDLTDELAKQFGYEDKSGVIVTEVDPSSQAAEIGIAPGTLITEVNRQKVEDSKGFWELIGKAQDSVLLYVHQGEISRYVAIKFNK